MYKFLSILNFNKTGFHSIIYSKIIELFLVNDMQTTPSPLKKSRFDILVQIVEKRSETNEL